MWHISALRELRNSQGFTGANAWRTQLELKWHSYDTVGRVVDGVVFSLTQLDSVELVVSSLTDLYTSESGVN